jgi:hypothetical protein
VMVRVVSVATPPEKGQWKSETWVTASFVSEERDKSLRGRKKKAHSKKKIHVLPLLRKEGSISVVVLRSTAAALATSTYLLCLLARSSSTNKSDTYIPTYRTFGCMKVLSSKSAD